MLNKKLYIFLLILIFSCIFSCDSNKELENNAEKVDIPVFPMKDLDNIIDSDGSLKRVLKNGVLLVGADPDSKLPFISKNKRTNKFYGFEAEIAEYITKKLQVKLKIIPTKWSELIKDLKRKRYDIILNAFEIPEDEELKKGLIFTRTYYTSSQCIIVPAKDKITYNLSDLKGKKVGVSEISVAKIMLEEMIRIKDIDISLSVYPNNETLFKELKDNKLDSVVIDKPIGSWFCKQNKEFKITGDPILKSEYVIVLREKDKSLMSTLNLILNNAIKDKVFKRIRQRWFL